MSHARALLPYGLAAAAIVATSSVVMAVAIGTSTHPSRTETTGPGGSPTLSSDTRLAYWRESTDRRWDLWVSELDGSRKWSVATERIGDISLTRWRPDGEAVSYVRTRNVLVVVSIVGAPTSIPLTPALVADKWAIVGYEWSVDGARVAVTLRDAGGASRESDVWAVEVSSGEWRRVTETGDAIAGAWVDEDELFIESMSGFVGLARLGPEVEMHPVTGMPAASPWIGDDGRLYLVGGSVNCGQVASGPAAVPYGCGGIWSMALDGTDVRREMEDEQSNIRLLGRWIDERFVVSRSGSAEIIGESGMILPWSAGLIHDVEPLTERRAIALTRDRVLLLDPEIVKPTTGLDGPSPGLTILLDRVYDPQLWRPTATVEALRSGTDRRGPPPRSAFVLGKSLWLADGDGPPQQILSAKADQWIGRPQWSPDGERLAVAVSESNAVPGALLVFDRIGTMNLRLEGRGGRPSWSPDGRSLAIPVWTEEHASIHLYNFDGSAAGPIDGTEAVWTERGLLVLVGAQSEALRPSPQRVDIVTGTERRTLVDAAALAADRRLDGVGSRSAPLVVYSLTAPTAGTYVALSVYRSGAGAAQAQVFVRTSDGAVVNVMPEPWRRGFVPEWSPRGDLFARNAGPFPASNQEDLGRGNAVVAEVVDPVSGNIVATAPGEFAGWAGDGQTWFVARPQGLFAYDLDGAGGALVSPYGVPLSIAPR